MKERFPKKESALPLTAPQIEAAHDLAAKIRRAPHRQGSFADIEELEDFADLFLRQVSHAALKGDILGLDLDLPRGEMVSAEVTNLVVEAKVPGIGFLLEPSPGNDIHFRPTRIIGIKVVSSYKPQNTGS